MKTQNSIELSCIIVGPGVHTPEKKNQDQNGRFLLYRKVLTDAKLNTALSARALTRLCLGRYINLLNTQTERKRLFFELSEQNPLLFCPATPRKTREYVAWFP